MVRKEECSPELEGPYLLHFLKVKIIHFLEMGHLEVRKQGSLFNSIPEGVRERNSG